MEDKDTPAEDVQMIVKAGPTHGQLHLTSQKQPVSSFTQGNVHITSVFQLTSFHLTQLTLAFWEVRDGIHYIKCVYLCFYLIV